MISVNAFILLIMAALRPAALECVPAPPLAALFTPPRPELGRYEACTSDAQLEGDADALEALDAFGSAGPYDRAAVQRLYGVRASACNGPGLRRQTSSSRRRGCPRTPTRRSPGCSRGRSKSAGVSRVRPARRCTRRDRM